MNPLVVTIWSFLGVLGYVTAHAVIERLLFHSCCRFARRFELDQFCAQLREFRSLEFMKGRMTCRGDESCGPSWLFTILNRDRLGWLGPLVHQADGTRAELKRLIHEFEAAPNRFSNFLATMVNVGGYLGLMGTVLAFVQMANSTQNFAKLMPLAFETTLAGLLISIPASLSFGLLSPRADLILDQVDLVLDAIDDTSQADASTVVSSQNSVSAREELTAVVSSLNRLAESQELAGKQQEKLVKQLEDCIADGYLSSPTDSVRLALMEAFAKIGDEDIPNRVNGNNGSSRKGKTNGTVKTR